MSTLDAQDDIDRASHLVEAVMMASASLERTSRAALQEVCNAIQERLKAARESLQLAQG